MYFGLYWKAPKKPRITKMIWKKLRRMRAQRKPRKSNTCFSTMVTCWKAFVYPFVYVAVTLTICRTHIVRKKYLLLQIPMSFALSY